VYGEHQEPLGTRGFASNGHRKRLWYGHLVQGRILGCGGSARGVNGDEASVPGGCRPQPGGSWVAKATDSTGLFVGAGGHRTQTPTLGRLMIPRDYPSCTSSLARICGRMNLAMSAQIFVGGLGAVAPETAAFFDTGCRSCAICETCKGLICKVLG
jgi:hypothetical protein